VPPVPVSDLHGCYVLLHGGNEGDVPRPVNTRWAPVCWETPRETLSYRASRAGQRGPAIFKGLNPLKMERPETRVSRDTS
jgi:hypothetical protein